MAQDRKQRRIFVGYDSREDIAWQVCRHSLLRHSKSLLDIHSLRQDYLRETGLYTRSSDKTSSTEFSLTRFLTPHIADANEWCMFVDCDFLFTRDVTDIFAGLDDSKALYVVKHDYVPANSVKMDGKAQTVYPRKNWSSMMLFNGASPYVRALTPSVVNTASPSYLHRFEWLPDEAIGELDLQWNFLEGEYPPTPVPPAAIHYTNGGPWFEQWQSVDYADLWLAERQLYMNSQDNTVELLRQTR